MRIAAVLCAAALTACATAASGASVSAPTQPDQTVTLNPPTTTMPPTTLPPTTTSTTTTVAPVAVPSDTPCVEWLPLAVQVGWPNDTDILQTLGQIMWRESRCQPDACSNSDDGKPCRDYGLTQGNWTAHHEWWADLGITPEEMFDPATNLRWAYLLYSGREARGQCGWQPWSKPCK